MVRYSPNTVYVSFMRAISLIERVNIRPNQTLDLWTQTKLSINICQTHDWTAYSVPHRQCLVYSRCSTNVCSMNKWKFCLFRRKRGATAVWRELQGITVKGSSVWEPEILSAWPSVHRAFWAETSAYLGVYRSLHLCQGTRSAAIWLAV